MSLWTSNRKWLPPPPQHHSKNPMNCPTVKSSPSVTKGSVAQKPCSSLPSWVWNLAVSTRLYTIQSWSATSISVRTCTPTPYSQVVPPCTQVLLTECKRKSQPSLHQPSKLRSSLHQKGSTPYGSAVPSWLHFLPSNRCGSLNKNTTNQVQVLSTASASKQHDRHTFHLALCKNIVLVMSREIKYYLFVILSTVMNVRTVPTNYYCVNIILQKYERKEDFFYF